MFVMVYCQSGVNTSVKRRYDMLKLGAPEVLRDVKQCVNVC